MSKLSPIPIISIGLMIAIAALSFGWFMVIEPNNVEAAALNTWAEQLEAEGAKLPAARKRVEDAKAMVAQKAEEWKAVAETKSPPASYIDLSQNGWQLAIDVRGFRNKLQTDVNRQMKRGGVTVVNGPTVEMPPSEPNGIVAGYFNYPPLGFPVVIQDFGPVQVRGTYSQIIANVRSWSNMPGYLAVTDGLQITGTTPVFNATYNLTLVAYIRGGNFFPAVPEGGA